MNSADPVLDARRDIAARVEGCLGAIERWNGRLRALISVDAAGARAAARSEAAGRDGGVILAVKDNIDVAGLPSTSGSRFFADLTPEADAAVVARLRAALAIIVGKANMHEFAFGGTTQNPHYGACRNPWDERRIPGGSSGGSAAAVAAGMCDAALGTDTGGSVRAPAALNGLVGLRPTPGRISNRGVFPISRRFDTVGPLARTASMAASVYRAIAGFDPDDPDSADRPLDPWCGDPLKGARIGLPTSYFYDEIEPEVAAALAAACEALTGLGAEPRAVTVEGASETHDAMASVICADAFELHKERVAQRPELFGADVLERLRVGERTTREQYAAGLAACERWRAHVAAIFGEVDYILTPTVGCEAPLIDAAGSTMSRTHSLTRNTFVWSFAATPAISIPCGFTRRGLPIGMQLVGRPWNEERLLAVAQAYQEVTDHHRRAPTLGAAA